MLIRWEAEGWGSSRISQCPLDCFSQKKPFLEKKEGRAKLALVEWLELVDGVEGDGDGVAVVVANQAVKVAFQGVIPADFQAG